MYIFNAEREVFTKSSYKKYKFLIIIYANHINPVDYIIWLLTSTLKLVEDN